jgi:hypothetical protein
MRPQRAGELRHLVDLGPLRRLLNACRPAWPFVNLPALLHALKLWGANASFDHRDHPAGLVGSSGRRILETLSDDRRFRATILRSVEPVLRKTPQGIRSLSRQDGMVFQATALAAHIDQYLEVMGAAAVSLAHPVVAENNESGTLADVLRYSLNRFSLGQELEFTACACAYYLPPRSTWTNRFGQTFSFDVLARALLDQEPGRGACAGAHVPVALATLWNINNQCRLLSQKTRRSIERYFRDLSITLSSTQHSRGYWDSDAIDGKPRLVIPDYPIELRAAGIVGHHLEWISMVSADMRPVEAVVRQAVDYVTGQVGAIGGQYAHDPRNYCPISHAAYGLVGITAADPVTLLGGQP